MAGTLHAPRSTTVKGKIRVLIVDNSVAIRHLIKEALGSDPAIEVVGAEVNGVSALARIPQVHPDVVTLDIDTPETNGIDTLAQIRQLHPNVRTIMFCTLTRRGGASTLEALAAGADDYIARPVSTDLPDESVASLRSDLIPRIKQFFVPAVSVCPAPVIKPTPVRAPRAHQPRIVVIGVSTGGPEALMQIIPKLPGNLPVPVLIVQHMPPMFTRMLAERLDAVSPLTVTEAHDGDEIRPGRILVAPGDYHLRIAKSGPKMVAALDQGPHENSCRPAVNPLFRSAAELYGGNVLSVILTGMGSDGLKGQRELTAAGARCIVQDEATSVVWGMPGAVVSAGLADKVLPLEHIATEIVRMVRG